MEPERNIEKLLRAYAKKRRAGWSVAFKLHPSTRRQLQAEVAKQFADPAEEDSVSLWQLLRQQWAVLASFALVIFFGAVLFLPALSKAKYKSQQVVALSQLKQIGAAADLAADENNGRLPVTLDALKNGVISEKTLTDPVSGKRFVYVASGKNRGDLQSNSVLAYSPDAKINRAVLLADGEVRTMSPKQFDELSRLGLVQPAKPAEVAEAPRKNAPQSDLAANHLAPASTPMTMTGNFAMSADRTGIGGQPVAPPVALAANGGRTPASNQLVFEPESRAKLVQAGINNNSQKFVQTAANTAKALPLLTTFEIQQNGDAILVVDQDGSVYQGSLQTNAPALLTLTTTAASQGQALDAYAARNELAGTKNNFFQVAGQNRISKQNVVFVGNLVSFASESAKIRHDSSGNMADVHGELKQTTISQTDWSNYRIKGRVIVDSTNQIEMNAVPVIP